MNEFIKESIPVLKTWIIGVSIMALVVFLLWLFFGVKEKGSVMNYQTVSIDSIECIKADKDLLGDSLILLSSEVINDSARINTYEMNDSIYEVIRKLGSNKITIHQRGK